MGSWSTVSRRSRPELAAAGFAAGLGTLWGAIYGFVARVSGRAHDADRGRVHQRPDNPSRAVPVAIITPSVGSIMIVLGIASWQGTARLFEVKCW